MTLWQRLAYWGLAPAISLALYWQGLLSWFREDDFAWLGLHLSINEPRDIWWILFSPMAQGTIRPLSERLYFLVLHKLFDFNALPFHAVAFLTQFLAAWLLQAITWRLTGSRFAAVAAAVFWTANSSLARPISWASGYNQIQCSAFILGAFLCLLRYSESGEKKWLYGQWALFLLGFGSLELNVVYPALAACWAVLFRRDLLSRVAPLFLVSILYTVVHRHFAPAEAPALYKMYFDSDLVRTLGKYFLLVFGSFDEGLSDVWSKWALISTGISAVTLAAFLAWQCWRRQWLAVFCLAWFVGVLAPLLPLKFHIISYYLVIPAIGLAIAAGWGCQIAWQAGRTYAMCAMLGTLSYIAGSGYMGHFVAGYHAEQTKVAKPLFFGVQQAAQLHPGKILLLAGISSEQFWSVMSDSAFRLLPGPPEVYLTPEAGANIDPHPEINDIAPSVMPSAAARRALEAGDALVYQPQAGKLKNVTAFYRTLYPQLWPLEAPSRIDVGQKYLSDFVGPGWYPIEHNKLRWMSHRGELTMSGPAKTATRIEVTCFRFGNDPRPGSLRLKLTVNGHDLGSQEIPAGEAEHHLGYELQGRKFEESKTTVMLEVTPVYSSKNDERELGLVLGNLAWK